MKMRLFISVIVALLIFDIGYSFLQHYNTPLDGDMVGGIIPSEDVQSILDNPLGLEAFTESEKYSNPNRFFAHWSFYGYFNSIPFVLQNFATPTDSVYVASALAKILTQVLLIFTLAFIASGKLWSKWTLISAIIITPLFQTNGYQNYMGIIDSSVTYTFFYALPILLLVFYLSPLFLNFFHGKSFFRPKPLHLIWIIPFAIVVSLSGPLNPGISLVLCFVLFVKITLSTFQKSNDKNLSSLFSSILKNIPSIYYYLLVPLIFFSVYSLILGTYSLTELGNNKTIGHLYSRIPNGLYYIFTRKLGTSLLIVLILINALIIRYKCNKKEGEKILSFLKWLGLFAIIYVLLLPLGGYRDYRPNIIRYDTFLPLTLTFIFIYGKSSLFILQKLSGQPKYFYTFLIITAMFIYTIADRPGFNDSDCQRSAISTIANSDQKVVEISDECKVISWQKVTDPEESELITRLLSRWNIIEPDKRFYQTERQSQ